jgi:hypothetical protein
MAIYDDKTAGIIKADEYFIINEVKSRTEAVFKASYLVASNLCVSGKITALFDLIVVGDVSAEDIEVKGKFICLGDCTVESSIVVQDKMSVQHVKAKTIEVHDEIIAQEIDVDTIKADGNIIVGQTLATEELAYSSQNILCGDTAYGAGRISANAIVTVEELDMDDGEEAVVEPNKIIFESKKEEKVVLSGAKYAKNNDYESYFTELWGEADEDLQRKILRWRRALKVAEDVLEQSESTFSCFDAGLMLTLTEIANSSYFDEWFEIKAWWENLLVHFNNIAEGKLTGLKKNLTMDDFAVNLRIKHATFGAGVVKAVKGGGMVEILFDSGKKSAFQLGIALKFFSLEDANAVTPEQLQAQLFVEPIEFSEWLAYLNILELYVQVFSPKLLNILKELLYAKMGLKPKFVSERINDNGWDD